MNNRNINKIKWENSDSSKKQQQLLIPYWLAKSKYLLIWWEAKITLKQAKTLLQDMVKDYHFLP